MTQYISFETKPFHVIWIHLGNRKFGFCFCHHRPDRSIKFFGIEKYLCARCFGMLIGIVSGTCIQLLFPLGAGVGLCLMLPLVMDGGIQFLCHSYESNNLKRLISGIFFGIGILAFIPGLNVFGYGIW